MFLSLFYLVSCFPHAVKVFIFANFVLILCVCVCSFHGGFGEKATNKPVAIKPLVFACDSRELHCMLYVATILSQLYLKPFL